MRRSARLLFLAAFAILTVAPSISGASVMSGLHGSVRRGPTHPVCDPTAPCTKPAPGVRVSFVRGAVVRHVRSNTLGHYSIRLAPGRYTVRIPNASFGYSPHSATVSRGHMSRLNILIDTGIR